MRRHRLKEVVRVRMGAVDPDQGLGATVRVPERGQGEAQLVLSRESIQVVGGCELALERGEQEFGVLLVLPEEGRQRGGLLPRSLRQALGDVGLVPFDAERPCPVLGVSSVVLLDGLPSGVESPPTRARAPRRHAQAAIRAGRARAARRFWNAHAAAPASTAMKGRKRNPRPAVEDRDCRIAQPPAASASANATRLDAMPRRLPRKNSTPSPIR